MEAEDPLWWPLKRVAEEISKILLQLKIINEVVTERITSPSKELKHSRWTKTRGNAPQYWKEPAEEVQASPWDASLCHLGEVLWGMSYFEEGIDQGHTGEIRSF